MTKSDYSYFISISSEYCLVYVKDKSDPNSYFIENIPKSSSDMTQNEDGEFIQAGGRRILVGQQTFNDKVDYESEKHYSVYYNAAENDMKIIKEKNISDINNGLINDGYKRFISFNGDDFVENTYTASTFKEMFENNSLIFSIIISTILSKVISVSKIEIALSYKNLMSLCNYTQDQLSERVGKNRATIANYVRLLSLPAEIQLGLKEKKIDMGHARGLLQAKDSVDQLKIYEEILKNGLSVRKVEEMARNMNLGNEVTQSEPKKTKKEEVPEEYGVMQERLSSLFGTNVDLSVNAKGKGKISIPFKNDDELAKIMEVLDSMGSNSEIN